ncbi:MAG: transcription-repair coupling factor, partial [Spirochaetia bacterium]|nr:transcription-repair coupling factor [Spirochaetia bacterium]
GVLIIDEEQRFGVVHKEAIKKMRKMVDVLTLSATPIPRTLHMSLVGIRDLSIIQTPPRDRLPVETFVTEDSESLLKEALRRELERDGQVFFLHNRIESIEQAAKRVTDMFPDVRTAVLHGQMAEEEIEDVLLDFMERKYDVLVTTAIIENGIDMPNVNTLIVDRADTFGLSQLYQIRGRVGRSNRQAYAYLFYPKGRLLTEEAQKRLHAIMEYQELGSGFKVAMRDLEIRGAGNIFGREQSGHIIDVGYELYIKMLEEAVRRLQGAVHQIEVRTSINLNADFFLPADYIVDTRQRIELYKRFEGAQELSEVEELAREMQERFGEPPDSARSFVRIEMIRTLASRAGFESVYEEDSGKVHMKAGETFRVSRDHLIQVLRTDDRLKVLPGSADTLFVEPKGPSDSRMDEILSILKELVVS